MELLTGASGCPTQVREDSRAALAVSRMGVGNEHCFY
jgi:hypothetical protein